MKSNSILNVDTKVISRSSYMILQQQQNEETAVATKMAGAEIGVPRMKLEVNKVAKRYNDSWT